MAKTVLEHLFEHMYIFLATRLWYPMTNNLKKKQFLLNFYKYIFVSYLKQHISSIHANL